jgi:hypothetical protein
MAKTKVSKKKKKGGSKIRRRIASWQDAAGTTTPSWTPWWR